MHRMFGKFATRVVRNIPDEGGAAAMFSAEEENILGSIPGFDDEPAQEVPTDEAATTTPGEGTGSGNTGREDAHGLPDTQQQRPADDASQQRGEEKPRSKQQQQQPQTQQPQEDTLRPHPAGFLTNEKGDVVDQHGNVIAAAGKERRLFESNVNAQQYIAAQTDALNKMQARLQELSVLNGAPQRLGLQDSDVQEALAMAAAFKKDPVKTAQYLLARTLQMGHNISEVLGEGHNGVEMAALRSMIDEAVGPMRRDREEAQRREEVNARVQQEYARFIATHENAQIHEGDIAEMMQRTGMDESAAYWRLRAYAAQHGLDFSKPLAPQLRAKQGGNLPQQNTASQPSKPLTTGRTAAPTTSIQPNVNPSQVRADTGWGDIIRGALHDARNSQ